MSLTGLKLSQINNTQEPLKDTDLFYYVTESPGPVYDSKRGNLKLVREYVDFTLGQEIRAELIAADTAIKQHADTIVEQEKNARLSADAVLTQAVADEVSARLEAIINEKSERVTAIAAEAATRTTQISTETANRTSADADLLEAITAETTNRSTADAALTAALADEVSARATSESALLSSITSEETTRVAAIASVQASISTEATNRLNADTKLTTDLSTEVNNRISADSALSASITTAQASLTAETIARTNADTQLAEDISQEITDRTQAVANEATARLALKTAVDASLALKADLVSGKIPASQLPSYVDDVIEVVLFTDLPAEGEAGKIYVVKNTNLTYRWTGTDYIEISKSLAIGETDSTAYRGDRGKLAYDHSMITAGNPHGTTKAHVGLGNVDNTADVNKPVSTATQTALDLKVNKTDTYVKTVNTQSGDVVLTKSSVGLANVDNTTDLNKPISTATQTALDLKANIPAAIKHTTTGDYTNITTRKALRLTDATDQPVTIDLATIPKNSGIVLTLTDISTNITDKLTTKNTKQLLVYKDTAGVVTEAAGTAGVTISGQVVSVVYKGVASKVIKTLITINVEALSEDNAVA